MLTDNISQKLFFFLSFQSYSKIKTEQTLYLLRDLIVTTFTCLFINFFMVINVTAYQALLFLD